MAHSVFLLIIGLACCLNAQDIPASTTGGSSSRKDNIWISGQVNVVNQSHPAFRAAYSGPDSLSPQAETATTWVATVYTGYAFSPATEVFVDVESAHGRGVSSALGLGGLGDLDAVTDQSDAATPYLARAEVRHIFALAQQRTDAIRSPLSLATSIPVKRIEVRVGKMSLADFFDLNSVGSDSHSQFLNYSIDNNAAYDIAANSRGYTYGVLVELYEPGWAARAALALEPTDPTGHRIQWNVSKARAENFEFEIDPSLIRGRAGALRFLTFIDHAEMGSYTEADAAYRNGEDVQPNLALHIHPARNYGFGLNGEQELTSSIRVFGRFGWNEGSHEAFQFAEADRTFAIGGDTNGRLWRKNSHHSGVAFAINGLSKPHREYLEEQGVSYLLGDRGLVYDRETTLEAYYNLPLGHGIFAGFDVQRIWNPGYNYARGPVIIFGLRLHAERDAHFN